MIECYSTFSKHQGYPLSIEDLVGMYYLNGFLLLLLLNPKLLQILSPTFGKSSRIRVRDYNFYYEKSYQG